MNRSRRNLPQQKSFVSGGIYDPQQQFADRNAPPPPKMPCFAGADAVMVSFMPDVAPIITTGTIDSIIPTATAAPNTAAPPNTTAPPKTTAPPNTTAAAAAAANTTATAAPNATTDPTDGSAADGSDERKGYFKKVFGFRKKPSIRAREKKIRQNRRLRKVLLPKNALMALHEVKNIKIEDFIINSSSGGGFIATVTVNNVQYDGKGNSKNAAKNNACEKALRDLVISKMNQKSKQNFDMKTDDGEGAAGSSITDDDVLMKEVDEQDDDELPMLNLASFALFKLFSEWEAEGYEIPEFRPHAGQNSNGNNSDGGIPIEKPEKPKKVPSIRNELPANWETMHPATLLCMMRPGISYTDEGSEGMSPNIIQKMGVTVDNETFLGVGRSKKIARKNAAVNACNKLYGANFIQFEN